MPAKAKHREPIISAAVRLFRRQGYAGTGLNDIVDESGAPKGSLYYYFPKGKVSIAVAAVEEAGRRVAETMEKLTGETRSTGEFLVRHGEQLAGWMRKSGYRDGCPIATVLLELAPKERGIAEAGRKAYAARFDVLSRKLRDDGFPHAEAARLAVLCISSLQGALIQARVERSPKAIITTAQELGRLLRCAQK